MMADINLTFSCQSSKRPTEEASMANPTDEEVARLIADPHAMDKLNQAVIDEFRANQGNVSRTVEGMPILLLTMTGAKTGRTLIRPLCYSRDGDRIVIIASYGGAPQSSLVPQSDRQSGGHGRGR